MRDRERGAKIRPVKIRIFKLNGKKYREFGSVKITDTETFVPVNYLVIDFRTEKLFSELNR